MVIADKAGRAVYARYDLEIGVRSEGKVEPFRKTIANEISDNQNLPGIRLLVHEFDSGARHWRRCRA